MHKKKIKKKLKKLCNVMKELNLDMSKIVAECFGDASNMKGENKGLATRMKVTSPMSIHIYSLLWSPHKFSVARYFGECTCSSKYIGNYPTLLQFFGSKPQEACYI